MTSKVLGDSECANAGEAPLRAAWLRVPSSVPQESRPQTLTVRPQKVPRRNHVSHWSKCRSNI